jgi:hypothetical protein
MRAIIRMERKRKEVDGKESEFLVRNRVVPRKKIRRYMKRTEAPAHAPVPQSSPAGNVINLLSWFAFLIVSHQHLLLRTYYVTRHWQQVLQRQTQCPTYDLSPVLLLHKPIICP